MSLSWWADRQRVRPRSRRNWPDRRRSDQDRRRRGVASGTEDSIHVREPSQQGVRARQTAQHGRPGDSIRDGAGHGCDLRLLRTPPQQHTSDRGSNFVRVPSSGMACIPTPEATSRSYLSPGQDEVPIVRRGESSPAVRSEADRRSPQRYYVFVPKRHSLLTARLRAICGLGYRGRATWRFRDRMPGVADADWARRWRHGSRPKKLLAVGPARPVRSFPPPFGWLLGR